MLFLHISKHSPESCLMHNEKTKKIIADLMAKMGQLAKKHGIKVVGGWAAVPGHLLGNSLGRAKLGSYPGSRWNQKPWLDGLQHY
jgi:hypothetical protein